MKLCNFLHAAADFRTRWLRQYMALLLVLVGLSAAQANNYFYRDQTPIMISNDGNGNIVLKYLTYDYDKHNFLYDFRADLIANGKQILMFYHDGAYEGCPQHYNDGYGDATIYTIYDATEKTYASGTARYREITFHIPLYYAGTAQIHYTGFFYYAPKLDGTAETCKIDYYSDSFSLSGRLPDPTVSSVALKPDPSKLTVSLDNLPYFDNEDVTTKVYLTFTDGETVEKDVTATSQEFEIDLPKFADITSTSNSVTVKTSVAYGSLTEYSNAVSKPVPPFAKATLHTAEFDSYRRIVDLAWDAENTESASYVMVFRRTLGEEWENREGKLKPSTTTFSDYADTFSGIKPNVTYEYKIVYGSDQWPDPTGDADWKGTSTKQVTTKPDMPIELTTTRKAGAIILDWHIRHSEQFIRRSVEIYRAQGNGEFTKIAEQTYAETGQYEDSGISGTYRYYILLKSADTWYKQEFSSDKVTESTIDATYISDMRASKGDFAGRVHLEWDVKNFANPTTGNYYRTTYNVLRKSMEDASSAYVKLSTFSSTDDYLQYDDETALPGIYYDYRVEYTTTANDDETQVDGVATAIGFTLSSGKVMGSITYGTGMAVEGVDVLALRTSSGNDMSSSRALLFDGEGAAHVKVTSDFYETLFGGDFSIQMWLKPEASGSSATYYPFSNSDKHKLSLSADSNAECSLWYEAGDSRYQVMDGIPSGEYSHLTITRSGDNVRAILYKQREDGFLPETRETAVNSDPLFSDSMEIGASYKGSIDEYRVWSKALTDEEVEDNYNRSMVGNETGLAMYYRLDEGLQTQFFDCSRKGTAQNGHHGTLDPGVSSTSDVPSHLGYRGKTDIDGNYIIEGIPFGGEGTSYSIVPQLGIHEFSPIKHMRYIGPSSLVHNGTDFEDVSSFPVSGVVYYENTLFPVEGCSLYVDGTVCSRDGEMILTDANGHFTIDVPIGDHYIEIRKQDHTFTASGRYPEDPQKVGTRYTFTQRLDGLAFYDNTLVNLSGRVDGGVVESQKPLGFGLSENNIGQVEMVLQPVDDRFSLNVVRTTSESSVSYENNPDVLYCESATGDIKSNAWRGAGNDSKKIYVQTDVNTGEFSAKIPPLHYKVLSAKIIKNGTSVIDSEAGVSEIDLTNPGYTESDTVETEEGTKTYVYNQAFILDYHTSPMLTVQDQDALENAFGERSYKYEDDYGKGVVDDIYTVDSDGKVSYTYGAPVFVSRNLYNFKIKGYEEYVNADKALSDTTRVSRVPLAGVVVTIANEISSTQPVYLEGDDEGTVAERKLHEAVLDENGEATYLWYGGLPNISESGQPDVPNYSRTISMTYSIDGHNYDWSGSGMHCILLGELTTGNNFVTQGPDVPDMVLRDPPGTRSYTEWTEGTVSTYTTVEGKVIDSQTTDKNTVHIGTTAMVMEGVGFLVMSSFETIADVIAGVKVVDEEVRDSSSSKTLSIVSSIATSDSPEYVGSKGDVYIGSSTNMTIGDARKIGFTRESATSSPKITRRDVTSTGLTFSTMFNYSQHYIENVLIPNWKKLITQKLVYATEEEIENFTNTTSKVVYRTKYRPGDKEYATIGSYKMFDPVNSSELYADSVAWMINQVDNWEKIIAMNEKDKVESYYNKKDKCLLKNVSFDSGTSLTYSEENESTETTVFDKVVKGIAIVGGKSGLRVNRVGIEIEVGTESGGGKHTGNTQVETSASKFAYHLQESGISDALTVDILKSTSGWSPLFHTRAGQTCGPYEGEERTKYYEPDKYVLNEATMRVEVPKISVDVPVLGDLPTGSHANFTLRLSNESETNDDVYYKLLVDDESNPNGASITIDGSSLTEGRRVKVPAGQTVTKLMQLKQTDISVLDYENIAVVLASETQFDPTSTWEVIADTCRVTAHFVPSSTEVSMHIDAPTINTETGTKLNINFDNFDRNYYGLKAFRVQYRAKGDNNWNNVQEFVLSESDKTANNQMLPDGSKVDLLVDMQDNVDGEYTFRVISVSIYGGSEVVRASNEIVVVKDMMRPQLISIPTPTDGILHSGDEISVTFNEDIRKGYVTEAANFLVRGRLNGAKVSHDGVFRSQGGAGAKTQASIDLAGRDFAVGHWVKWTKAGSLVHHGTASNSLDIAVTDAGKLKVTISGQEYTSANAIPQDKWCYLNVSYDTNDGEPLLTADVAEDSNTTSLFDGQSVNAYEGNGALTIGQGVSAAIHEVTLWNYARGFYPNEANVTRAASTEGLIGYWRLDEGHGTTGEDRARSRHLTMPEGDNWSMETENFALLLDGKSHASVNMTKTDVDSDSNYAIELWFRGDSDTGDATLFSTVADGVELMFAEEGLILNCAGESTVLSEKEYRDKTWHHFALNVLKSSGGMASAYVDGNLVAQINAANVPAFQTDRLTLGARRTHVDGSTYNFSQYFKGAIDELRFWNGTQSAATIHSNMHSKVFGDSPALEAYYPFEKVELDQFNQPVTTPTLSDMSQTGAEDAKIDDVVNWSTEESPALKNAPELENVPFSFVASDRKLLINLEAEQQRIEGCNLQFTVRGVEDMNGNYSDDINWSAYVKQNLLEWAQNEVKVIKEGAEEKSFSVDIVNESGEKVDWILSGLPIWLTVDNEAGSLQPLSSKTLVFNVDAGTAIGRYEAVVGLSGTNGVTDDLTVNLMVTGERPDWEVNTSQYEHTMNMVAQLKIDGKISEDTEDMVAAFMNGECRGVAQPVYYPHYDAYYLMMTIYGSIRDVMGDNEITFKAFDASTGDIYPEILPGEEIRFAIDMVKGTPDNPVMLTATGNREQTQLLSKGWNWISLFVNPEDNSVANVLASLGSSGVSAKSKTSHVNNRGDWAAGDLRTIEYGKMYKVLMNQDATLRLTGAMVNPAESPVTVTNGWNWIGFNSSNYLPVGEAFADLQPVNGDVVKSRGQFAMYMGYEWVGSLTALQPGQGYVYKSEAMGEKKFRYPVVNTGWSAPAMAASDAKCKYTPCDEHKYQGNMTMVAQAWRNDEPVECEIAVFDQNGECRASNLSMGDDNLVFLTIQGEGAGEILSFRVVYSADGAEQDVLAAETYSYVNDEMAGSPDEPFIIDLGGNTSSIHEIKVEGHEQFYDLNGLPVHESYKGYKVAKGRKVLEN